MYNEYGDLIGFDRALSINIIKNYPKYSYLYSDLEDLGLIFDKSSLHISVTELKELGNSSDSITTLSKKKLPKYTNDVRIAFVYRYTTNPTWTKAHNSCLGKELKKSFGPLVYTSIISAIAAKKWTLAAKRIAKAGIRLTLPAIIGTIQWINVDCASKTSKKHKRFKRPW